MEKNILSAFAAIVAEAGSSAAVTDGTTAYTYAELDLLSDRVALALLQRPGAAVQPPTGIYLAQKSAYVAAILGVLKTGGFFVPLDRQLPPARLDAIIKDAGIETILTTGDLIPELEPVPDGKGILIDLDRLLAGDPPLTPVLPRRANTDPEQGPATCSASGTTGRPKGVIQYQVNLLHFCGEFVSLLRLDSKDRIALTASFGHTVAMLDLFAALLSGASVAIYDTRANRSLPDLRAFIRDQSITVFHSIPSYFRAVFSGFTDMPGSLRLVVLGGEDVHRRDFELFRECCPPRAVFVNLYGSTEIIIASAFLANKKSLPERLRVPIGYPVAGVKLSIGTDNDKAAGILSTGEILVESAFLSPGYWDPEAGAAMPAAGLSGGPGGPKVYRSGDLGRLLPDGSVEFAGRQDGRIKINGHRIELLDIESNCCAHPGIKACVVKAFERNGEDLFIACFYQAEPGVDEEGLSQYLQTALPAHMLPEKWIRLDKFPLNPGGKIDRNALTRESIPSGHRSDPLPDDGFSIELLQIWSSILQHDQFGPDDKFLQVGGNSLKLSQLHLELNQRYPGLLTVQDLFDHQTIRAISTLRQQKEPGVMSAEKQLIDIEF